MMKAVIVEKPGDENALKLGEVPEPEDKGVVQLIGPETHRQLREHRQVDEDEKEKESRQNPRQGRQRRTEPAAAPERREGLDLVARQGDAS